jgi:hypothetical protein
MSLAAGTASKRLSSIVSSAPKLIVGRATSQNQDMVALLRDLRNQVSDGGQARIDDLLALVVEDVSEAAANILDTSETHDDAESSTGKEQRQLDEVPNVAQQVNMSKSRALESSFTDAEQPPLSTLVPPMALHPREVSIFLDDQLFEPDLEVDPFELPPFDVAEKLFQAYFQNVHNSYPLLNKRAFTHQFYYCTYTTICSGPMKHREASTLTSPVW